MYVLTQKPSSDHHEIQPPSLFRNLRLLRQPVASFLICLLAFSHLPTSWADAPSPTHLFPASLPCGSNTQVSVGGTLPTWPLQVWCDDPLIVITPLEEKGKLSITPAPNASPGLHHLRLFNESGCSKAIPFLIDTSPHTLEVEPNNSFKEAQKLSSLPLMIDGVLAKRGDVDTFALALQAGTRLVAHVDAHQSLRSPMDSNLQILDPQGNILEGNLDHQGLDPRIIYSVPTTATYLVRIFAFPSDPNSTIEFDGKETYVYRLTLTTGPFLLGAMPLATSSTNPQPVLPISYPPHSLSPITLPSPNSNRTIPLFHLEAIGVIPLEVHPYVNAIESPPTPTPTAVDPTNPSPPVPPNAPAQVPDQSLETPCVITGTISENLEADRYAFSSQANITWQFSIASRSLGYPLDAQLELLDEQGKVLATADDDGPNPDPRLTWKCPQEGRYRIVIKDLYGKGGLEYLYRLRIEPETPRIEPRIATDMLAGKVGTPVDITIDVTRSGNETRRVRFSLPSTEGVQCEPVFSEGTGDSAKQIKLQLTSQRPLQISLVITYEVLEQDQPILQGVVQPTSPAPNVWLSVTP